MPPAPPAKAQRWPESGRIRRWVPAEPGEGRAVSPPCAPVAQDVMPSTAASRSEPARIIILHRFFINITSKIYFTTAVPPAKHPDRIFAGQKGRMPCMASGLPPSYFPGALPGDPAEAQPPALLPLKPDECKHRCAYLCGHPQRAFHIPVHGGLAPPMRLQACHDRVLYCPGESKPPRQFPSQAAELLLPLKQPLLQRNLIIHMFTQAGSDARFHGPGSKNHINNGWRYPGAGSSGGSAAVWRSASAACART